MAVRDGAAHELVRDVVRPLGLLGRQHAGDRVGARGRMHPAAARCERREQAAEADERRAATEAFLHHAASWTYSCPCAASTTTCTTGRSKRRRTRATRSRASQFERPGGCVAMTIASARKRCSAYTIAWIGSASPT